MKKKKSIEKSGKKVAISANKIKLITDATYFRP
jgi:hypothetical protein